jgi:hypothetical protein
MIFGLTNKPRATTVSNYMETKMATQTNIQANLEQLVNHKDPTKGIMDDGTTTSWADDGWKLKSSKNCSHKVG